MIPYQSGNPNRFLTSFASALLLLALTQSAQAKSPPYKNPCISSLANNPDQLLEGKDLALCSHAQAAARSLVAQSPAAAPNADPPGGAEPREAESDSDVLHYLLDIELIPEYSGPDVADVRVHGTTTIDAQSKSPALSEFTVDLFTGMTLVAVTGNLTSWSRTGDQITIQLDHAYALDEDFQVAVEFDGHPQDTGFGAFKWWLRNGNLVVATLSEPYYARYWWACKDRLDDKSTFDIHCTVPQGMVVASNGILQGVDPLSGSRNKYRWQVNYPMVAYLASLAVTNYQRYDLTYNFTDDSGPRTMPVHSYLFPDHWSFSTSQPLADYKTGCDELLTMLDKFADAYGLYPFVDEKYAVAETGGADGIQSNMEHQTCTSMYQVNLYSDIMAHELAHHWWGDNLTCQTWQDIWLNEGFASYSECAYRELKPTGGSASYWARVIARRPGLPNNQVYRPDISSVGAIFSNNDVYNKGCWVLHMLRHVMGDAPFHQALADYRAAYQGDFATTAEFTDSISNSFGNDLSWFTSEWVMNPGAPDYEWNWSAETVAAQPYLKLAIWQKQSLQGFGLITMPIDIRITTPSGTIVHRVWNDAATEYYVLPIPALPTLVEFDELGGANNRNYILWDTRTKVTTALASPPAVLSTDIKPFAGPLCRTTIDLIFSENIGNLSPANVSLTGQLSGPHAPTLITYSSATRSAALEYDLPKGDDYTFTLLAANILANGQFLDGEIALGGWWDTTLLPSGDGQPGGNSVLNFTKPAADLDESGLADLGDIPLLVDVLLGNDTNPAHMILADTNCDTLNNALDIPPFLTDILSP